VPTGCISSGHGQKIEGGAASRERCCAAFLFGRNLGRLDSRRPMTNELGPTPRASHRDALER
jgi:hypothetical protein